MLTFRSSAPAHILSALTHPQHPASSMSSLTSIVRCYTIQFPKGLELTISQNDIPASLNVRTVRASYCSKTIWDEAGDQLESFPTELAPTLQENEVITTTKRRISKQFDARTSNHRSVLGVKGPAKLLKIFEAKAWYLLQGYSGLREEVKQLCVRAYGRHIARSHVDLTIALAELFNAAGEDSALNQATSQDLRL